MATGKPNRRSALSRSAVWMATMAAMAAAWPGRSAAHGPQAHGAKAAGAPEQKAWGIAGDPQRVVRTIDIRMSDAMRFTPARIEVQQGQTLRLRVRNEGKLMHELVIGTRQELEEHAALMKKFPQMAHDEPYMAHVDPGRTGQIVWHFNRPGQFEFACLVAGHFDAGMIGKIIVRASGSS